MLRRPVGISLLHGCLACFALLISLHPFALRAPSGVVHLLRWIVLQGGPLMVHQISTVSYLSTPRGRFDQGEGDSSVAADPGEEIASPYLWSRGLKELTRWS
jgi:hypothetical protein